jgi:diacylglycerol kinase family enzyme
MVRLLRLLPALRKGTHGAWDEVRAFSTTSLAIRTRSPRAVNFDAS